MVRSASPPRAASAPDPASTTHLPITSLTCASDRCVSQVVNKLRVESTTSEQCTRFVLMAEVDAAAIASGCGAAGASDALASTPARTRSSRPSRRCMAAAANGCPPAMAAAEATSSCGHTPSTPHEVAAPLARSGGGLRPAGARPRASLCGRPCRPGCVP